MVSWLHQLGNADLGAHAVGAGDQTGAGHAGHVQLEQAAEAADAVGHTGDHRPGHVLFHQLHSPVSGGDVHARGRVGGGVTFAHLASRFLDEVVILFF